MTTSVRPIKESLINLNLNELTHSLLRDLAMACRKVSIYGPRHPSSSRSVEKPFLLLDRLFSVRSRVNFNLQGGYLHVINIRLKDSVFNQEIIKYMQGLEINALLFEAGLSMRDIETFVTRFVTRSGPSDNSSAVGQYLKQQNIGTIQVNSETAYRLFENSKVYRGDVDYDASVKSVILQQLPDDLDKLALLAAGEGGDSAYFDFRQDIVQYLIPEKIAALPIGIVKRKIERHLHSLKESQNEDERQRLLDVGRSIYQLLKYHPDRKEIVNNFDTALSNDQDSLDIIKELQTPSGKIRLETSETIDRLVKEIFINEPAELKAEEFSAAYHRLLKTGQKDKALQVTMQLIEQLCSVRPDSRQWGLQLLLDTVKDLNLLIEMYVFENMVQITLKVLSEKKETFEFSEFIWQLLEKCRAEKEYRLMANLLASLNQRRHLESGVTTYDSMAVKKVFSNFNQSPVISQLIGELCEGDFKTSGYVRDIFVSVGSDEVAMALSNIVSHEKRSVRQQALKILGELGKASLRVFTQILVDDRMFEREAGRRELPDSQWYIIRNSIFVLGLIKDNEATIPLRLRINDPDVRVRREIIATLEKVSGEEACDILLMMANDPDREIRDTAVITLGLIGQPDMAPLLIDLTRRNPQVVIKAIKSLAKLGGVEARNYLLTLIKNDSVFNQLATEDAGKDEIRLAIIQALGEIGDEDSLKAIKEYRDSLSTAQKLFFKNSPINRTIDEILKRR